MSKEIEEVICKKCGETCPHLYNHELSLCYLCNSNNQSDIKKVIDRLHSVVFTLENELATIKAQISRLENTESTFRKKGKDEKQ